LDGCFDRGVGDDSEGLGGVVLVALEFDSAEAVGVVFNAEGTDGRVGSERGAGEALAGRAAIGQDLATAEGEERHRTSNTEHRTSKVGTGKEP
jgi:hypothetical protein